DRSVLAAALRQAGHGQLGVVPDRECRGDEALRAWAQPRTDRLVDPVLAERIVDPERADSCTDGDLAQVSPLGATEPRLLARPAVEVDRAHAARPFLMIASAHQRW